jgi:hypothetical protein
VTRSPSKRGTHPNIFHLWVLKPYIKIFYCYYVDFWRILPIFEDLEPFLRPDLGRKLGGNLQINIYINNRVLTIQRGLH